MEGIKQVSSRGLPSLSPAWQHAARARRLARATAAGKMFVELDILEYIYTG